MTSYLIGHFSVDGIVMRADNLAGKLHICLDSGAKKVLLPQTSAVDFGKVPAEFMNS
jgi:ATP-dependent Lon protease